MTPMLGTSSTLRFGITTRSRASSRTWLVSTTGSWARGSKDIPRLSRRRAPRVQDRFRNPDTVRVSLLVMELRLLRYFVAIAEERHFGRAAARLHMTQPPLSRAIKQLETDVGALLVHRSPAGVTLTPAGTALYDEAR